LVVAFIEGGGHAVVLDAFGENLPEDERERLLAHANVSRLENAPFSLEVLRDGPQLQLVRGRTDVAFTIRRAGDRAALHFIRYDYDDAADRVPILEELAISIRLPFQVRTSEALAPGTSSLRSTVMEDRLVLRDVPLFGIVLLSA
jgi:hypothetical protein